MLGSTGSSKHLLNFTSKFQKRAFKSLSFIEILVLAFGTPKKILVGCENMHFHQVDFMDRSSAPSIRLVKEARKEKHERVCVIVQVQTSVNAWLDQLIHTFTKLNR